MTLVYLFVQYKPPCTGVYLVFMKTLIITVHFRLFNTDCRPNDAHGQPVNERWTRAICYYFLREVHLNSTYALYFTRDYIIFILTHSDSMKMIYRTSRILFLPR